jgi:two-component system sensor kinase FixL
MRSPQQRFLLLGVHVCVVVRAFQPFQHSQDHLEGQHCLEALALFPVGAVQANTFTGSVRDITEHKRAEDRALLAERLAAIGQVSTGLAHESRNALARSQGCLEMLARRVQNRPDAMDLIDRIQAAQRQLLRLYEHVREYAAPITLDRRPCDLKDILYEAWGHLESEREGRDIPMQVEANQADLVCEVDRFRVEQVVRNVLENAISACDDSGTISVEFRETASDEQAAVCITVANDGPPLTSEERERIFEAFFTKKTRGSGLGMAISRRIVEAHGGQIAVGDPRDGVEIMIIFPRHQT